MRRERMMAEDARDRLREANVRESAAWRRLIPEQRGRPIAIGELLL